MNIPCEQCLVISLCRNKNEVTCPIVWDARDENTAVWYLDTIAKYLNKQDWTYTDESILFYNYGEY